MVSFSEVLIALGPIPSPNRKTLSMTESSVAVVSRPGVLLDYFIKKKRKRKGRNKHRRKNEEELWSLVPVTASQSLTTIPAPTTCDPRLTLPATRGTWTRSDSSFWSWTDVLGWTMPPWLLRAMYEPVRTLSAIVCRKTSTPRTSAILV